MADARLQQQQQRVRRNGVVQTKRLFPRRNATIIRTRKSRLAERSRQLPPAKVEPQTPRLQQATKVITSMMVMMNVDPKEEAKENTETSKKNDKNTVALNELAGLLSQQVDRAVNEGVYTPTNTVPKATRKHITVSKQRTRPKMEGRGKSTPQLRLSGRGKPSRRSLLRVRPKLAA